MVLKTSVASMTSTGMITSLVSMASLASKNCFYILSDFSGIRNLSSLNVLNTLNSSKNFVNFMFPSTHETKLPILFSQIQGSRVKCYNFRNMHQNLLKYWFILYYTLSWMTLYCQQTSVRLSHVKTM